MRLKRPRIRRKILFTLERQLVKGAQYQLLVVAALIGMISIFGGLLVIPTDTPNQSLGEAVWWAFLRLTDPGYLGDDQGNWRRFISTLLTIAGYVIFLGSLVAIITTWMNRKIRHLEQGLTPVTANNHIVILGWSNRTIHIAAEIFQSSGRLKRLFEKFNIKKLQLIILSEEVSPFQMQELKDNPMIGRRAHEIILRTGVAIDREHLRRVDALNAAVIIIPSLAYDRKELINPDVETIKCLLSLNAEARQFNFTTLPYVIAEIQDDHKINAAYRSYSGPLEIIGSNAIISRLMAQNIRHPGLSQVYNELLSQLTKNNIFTQEFPETINLPLESVKKAFTKAIVLGIVREENGAFVPYLNIDGNEIIKEKDQLILIARNFSDLELHKDLIEKEGTHLPKKKALSVEEQTGIIRILVLGWNEHVPSLIKELTTYEDESYYIRIVSLKPLQDRRKDFGIINEEHKRIEIDHIVADYLRESVIKKVEAETFDHILMVSSDRMEEEEEADARTMVGFVLLEEVLERSIKNPSILLELADPSNESLLKSFQSEVIISPMILSHLLASIAMQRELYSIYNELFTVGGPEIIFRNIEEYEINVATATFSELEEQASSYGETALGVFMQGDKGKRLVLNPPKEVTINLSAIDSLVILTTVY
ncbi:CASTOR/POLLUX-related putative ion channel [Cyclobacterium qasimii]|uniref:Potassium voltage-gated channel subfamily KQT n=2 Tax=Cyclobacterium qasimii TaxID=1350429 RepID=S7VLN3_9BACT|nr:Potassium voltage-gated channel subfamily KQT [Cyclobacterium qasimii]EPR70831.1 Potassium voltage-gated channel subfamily KQT [Cyclobacterium qasimii M12-11B]GEO24065.1 lipoprotein [Cyclobacterium qasimii]